MRCISRSICSVRLATVMCGLLAVAAADPSNEPVGLRVRIKLDVSGELLAPAGTDAPPVREPVEMTARFDFEETPPEASAAQAAVVRRLYRDATAVMKVGDATTTATLAADARRLLVARQGTTPMPYLADGFLSGEESDLLETPFDSLLLDDLLPREPVRAGQAWEIPADLTAGLLAIDTVESGVIEARVQEVSDGRAKVTFAGIIDGAVDDRRGQVCRGREGRSCDRCQHRLRVGAARTPWEGVSGFGGPPGTPAGEPCRARVRG